jgi:hypothetical protein
MIFFYCLGKFGISACSCAGSIFFWLWLLNLVWVCLRLSLLSNSLWLSRMMSSYLSYNSYCNSLLAGAELNEATVMHRNTVQEKNYQHFPSKRDLCIRLSPGLCIRAYVIAPANSLKAPRAAHTSRPALTRPGTNNAHIHKQINTNVLPSSARSVNEKCCRKPGVAFAS